MPQSSDAERRLLEKRLDTIRQREFIPAQLLEIVAQVYGRQIAARAEAEVVVPGPDALAPADQHVQGAPLLPLAEFPYDAKQAYALMDELLDILKGTDGQAGVAAAHVAEALKSGELTTEAAIQAFLAEDDAFFTAWGERMPDAPRVLLFLVQSSLAPSFEAVAKALAQHHEMDTPWSHQHCPVCGSLPLMAELRDKPGFRYACCSQCRTRYRIPRLACAFCGETDAEKLSYFTAEDEPGFRVEVCQSCKLYIKSADFRELDKVALPVIDDLESLSLDILAGNEGYKRPTLSGLGF